MHILWQINGCEVKWLLLHIRVLMCFGEMIKMQSIKNTSFLQPDSYIERVIKIPRISLNRRPHN